MVLFNFKVFSLRRSKIVSNKNQLARLVERMEENPDFAKGVYSKPLMSKKWGEIAVELNSLGPPERDSAKWQTVSIVFRI